MISNRLIRLFTALCLAILLSSCGGSGGSSNSSEGTQVRFYAQHSNSASPQGTGSKSITNTEGVDIRLNTAYVTIWSIEILTDCNSSSFAALGKHLLNFLISSANAHADESPTVLGTPHVIDLTQEDTDTMELGSLSPAAADYCGIEVALFPADDDAEGLPSEISMVGKTLYIEATYQSEGSNPVAFTIDLSTRALEKGLRYPALLQLNSNNLVAEKTITMDYSQWFDGVDFTQIDTSEQQDRVLTNVRNSLRVD